MKTNTKWTRIFTFFLAVLLVLPVLQANAASESSTAKNDVYTTYFNDVYERLTNQDHVYRSVTYHELDYLLKSEGTYVVLFGGAWNPDTQAVISYINDVAKEFGIKGIHHFDPRLDGKTVDIIDNDNNPFTRRYVELVDRYLTNIGDHATGTETISFTDTVTSGRAPNQVTKTIEGTAPKVETPFLFVYNKDNKQDSVSAPIIASLEKIDALLTDGEIDHAKADAYKAQVRDVFEAITGEADVIQNKDYITSSYNEFAETTIFDESDGDIVIDPVTYDELNHILASEGDYVILFGCSWCANTRAAIKFINQYAKQYDIDKVYNWDTKLDGGIGGTPGVESGTDSSNFLHTRTTGHPHANLYVDLVNTYLTNIETLYDKESNNVSYTNDAGEEIVANKLQVPYLFVYNKDRKDADGKSAPIAGHVELMYSWTNIQPDYESAGNKGVNYNIYTSSLDSLFSDLHGLAPQDAPEGIEGELPDSATSNNGKITNVSTALEYKRAEDTSYTPVTDTSITGLKHGSYYIRYAAKEGYKASPAVILNLNLQQESVPAGITGKAPTSSENNNGQLIGTTREMEYKLVDAASYKAAVNGATTGLPAGKYEVRYAAQYGYNAGQSIEVIIPDYEPVLFDDVPEKEWYFEAVSYLADNGITSGTGERTFSPESNVTRGQFIVLLMNAYGIQPSEQGANNFADAGNDYYTNYLAAAKELGIAEGVGDNRFEPDKDITRQDLFKLLHSALTLINKLPAANAESQLSDFVDVNRIADYAKPAIESFVESGIVTGNDKSEIEPLKQATRAETAQVLYNLLSQ